MEAAFALVLPTNEDTLRVPSAARIWAVTKSFWFLPSVLGLLGLVLAGVTIWVDRTYSDVVPFFQSLGAVTTRSVLQTIATASITVISLTYSITLVVFTLAAGNIGPRLLTRFRESTQTRLSIGVFCCTFLFAITVLSFVGDEHTPRLSAMIAFLLAIISVYVLIIYVQHVSSQVLVDNEVAKAAARVHAAVSALIREGKLENRGKHRQIPTPKPEWPVRAQKTGYVRSVETDSLLDSAKEHDCFIRVKVEPGDFVIEGIPIAVVYGCERRDIEDAVVCDGIVVGPSRQPDADVSFLIHLLIEIALRALSPGMNDSYTAVSCVDNLSATLAQLLRHEAPSAIHCDDDGQPRLYFEILNVRDTLNKTLRPLRISSRGNLLVTLRLLHALRDMAELALPKYQEFLRLHAELIVTDAKEYVSNPRDREDVLAAYNEVVKQAETATPAQTAV
ncbi:MAG: DUF2254 domain-containing protein [Terriglobales bacterium]